MHSYIYYLLFLYVVNIFPLQSYYKIIKYAINSDKICKFVCVLIVLYSIF